MTTVNVNFSQATLATLESYRAARGTPTLAQDFDQFVKTGYNFTSTHAVYTGGSLTGPDGYLDYPDGSFQTLSGLVNTTPGAANGTFSAGSIEDHVSGAYRLVYDGQLNFGYSTSASNGLLLTNKGGTINTLTLQQLVTSGSANYDTTIGNVTLKAFGTVTSGDGDHFSGVVDTLTRTTELFEEGGRITGTFNLSGSHSAIGQNTANTAISGTLTSYAQYYTDGSSAQITGAAMAVSGTTVANERQLLADAANFAGDDVIGVTLPNSVTQPWLIAAGAGNDRISITGGGAGLAVNAGSGRDTIVMNDFGHAIDGGSGVDTAVFSGARAAFSVASASGGYTIGAAAGVARNTLVDVERIQFSDGNVALDINGNGGQVYRLYQAAFNRTPDSAGAGYWLAVMDSGVSLLAISTGFTGSSEFQNLYGAQSDNAAIVTALYRNALHREPDQGGYSYWLGILNEHRASVQEVLMGFSESPENQAQVATVIGNGFAYTPYTG